MNKIINKNIENVNKIVEEVQKTYSDKKKKNIQVSLKFSPDHKENKKIYECATSIFTTIYKHKSKAEWKKELSFFTCKSKFCPVCNYNKSKKWAKLLYLKLTELQNKQEQRFLFLTLTIKNDKIENLDTTIKKMNKAWRNLWRSHFEKRFNGFIKSLEITFPNGNEAHPHFHILISTDRKYFYKSNKDYLKTEEISKLWGQVLKVDYNPSCDIKVIKPKKTKEGYISKDAIPAAVAEMLKYPMKDTDYNKLDFDTMDLLYSNLFRKRLIATGGNLKMSMNKVDTDTVEEIDNFEEWEKIAYLVMKYLKGGYVVAGGDYYK
jgi:plasmid rolling circle replication initiator protein Rep